MGVRRKGGRITQGTMIKQKTLQHPSLRRNVPLLIKSFTLKEESASVRLNFAAIIKSDNFFGTENLWRSRRISSSPCRVSYEKKVFAREGCAGPWQNFLPRNLTFFPDINLWNMDNIIRILHVKRIMSLRTHTHTWTPEWSFWVKILSL